MLNTTNISNANTLFEHYQAINILSGQFLSIMVLVAIFFILILIFRNTQEFTRVLIGIFFTLSVISFLFFFLGLIGWMILIWSIIGLFATIFKYMFTGE